jgi:hypothetical protein
VHSSYEERKNPWKGAWRFAILPAMPLSTIYSKAPDFIQRQVAGECILVPIRRSLSDANSIYVLNETGAALWDRIDGARSVQEIELDLTQEYDVAADQLRQDFETLLADLLSIRAIQEVSIHDGSPV